MRRDRLTAGVIIAVAGALVAAGTTFLVGKSGHSSAPVRGPGAVHISLGDVTSHAAQITVGGQTYQLQPGWSGTHHATVALTPDAGGVAVVRDRAGNVLATAPVGQCRDSLPKRPKRPAAPRPLISSCLPRAWPAGPAWRRSTLGSRWARPDWPRRGCAWPGRSAQASDAIQGTCHIQHPPRSAPTTRYTSITPGS